MAGKTMDVQEQRVRFVVEATQKRRSFGELCAAYEISRPTGWSTHARTGPRNPALENYRALDSEAQLLSTAVKDV